MSLDRSLKGKSTLERHRNVLRRIERVVNLEDHEKWSEGKSVFGLVKVGHRKQVAAKKAPKAEAAAAEGAAAATPGAAAAAAPAAGAKAAAPAAKAAAKK